MATLIPVRAGRRGRPYRAMVLSHSDELRLLRGPWRTGFAIVLALGYLALPLYVQDDTLAVLVLVAAYAIGAIGLNLLIGYTGQVSLGHAAFVSVGAFCTSALGDQRGWSFPAYLLAAIVIGLVIGAVVGPFALRLRGNYLAIVTIGLVFVAEHVYRNWPRVTSPVRGTAPTREAPVVIGPLDFRAGIEVAGAVYTKEQSLFWLSWALVAVTAMLAWNITRSRTGRAMQAVRDQDLSAEVIGVRPARVKVGVFAVSGAMAAAGGVVYALTLGALDYQEISGTRGLFMSITFVAIVILGGLGTIHGSILGALLVVYGQRFIADQGADAPVLGIPVQQGWMTTGELNGVLFGGLVVVFLLVEPRGIAALWARVRTWFQTWPFSY